MTDTSFNKPLGALERFTQAMVGWRKFTVAMFTIWCAYRLGMAGLLEGAGFTTTAIAVLGLFGLANVAGKYVANGPNGAERS